MRHAPHSPKLPNKCVARYSFKRILLCLIAKKRWHILLCPVGLRHPSETLHTCSTSREFLKWATQLYRNFTKFDLLVRKLINYRVRLIIDYVVYFYFEFINHKKNGKFFCHNFRHTLYTSLKEAILASSQSNSILFSLENIFLAVIFKKKNISILYLCKRSWNWFLKTIFQKKKKKSKLDFRKRKFKNSTNILSTRKIIVNPFEHSVWNGHIRWLDKFDRLRLKRGNLGR